MVWWLHGIVPAHLVKSGDHGGTVGRQFELSALLGECVPPHCDGQHATEQRDGYHRCADRQDGDPFAHGGSFLFVATRSGPSRVSVLSKTG